MIVSGKLKTNIKFSGAVEVVKISNHVEFSTVENFKRH